MANNINELDILFRRKSAEVRNRESGNNPPYNTPSPSSAPTLAEMLEQKSAEVRERAAKAQEERNIMPETVTPAQAPVIPSVAKPMIQPIKPEIQRINEGTKAEAVPSQAADYIRRVGNVSPVDVVKAVKEQKKAGGLSLNDKIIGVLENIGLELGHGVSEGITNIAETGAALQESQYHANKTEENRYGGGLFAPAPSTGKQVQTWTESLNRTAENIQKRKDITDKQKAEMIGDEITNSPIGKFTGDIAYSFGQQAPLLAIGALGGGTAGAATKAAIKATEFAALATQNFAPAYAQARSEGADENKASAFALTSSMTNAAEELLLGDILGTGASGFDKVFGKKLATAYGGKLSTPMARTVINAVGASLEEGAEEVLQGISEHLIKKAIYAPDAKLDVSELLYSGAVGVAAGGIGARLAAPSHYRVYKYDFDYVNGMAKAGERVSTAEQAETFKTAMNNGITACDKSIEYLTGLLKQKGTDGSLEGLTGDGINTDHSDFADEIKTEIERIKWIRDGMKTVHDNFIDNEQAIIEKNTRVSNAVEVAVDNAGDVADGAGDAVIKLVQTVAEESEPDADAVNEAIDIIHEVIEADTDALKAAKNDVQRDDIRKEIDGLRAVDESLRDNRAEINAALEAENGGNEENTVKSAENAVESAENAVESAGNEKTSEKSGEGTLQNGGNGDIIGDEKRTDTDMERANNPQPVENSVDNSGNISENAVETPVEKPSEAPTEAPMQKPVEAPVETPAQAPVEAQAETPAKEPAPAPAREFDLVHERIKHTKTGEMQDVFKKTRNLSTDEYVRLKEKITSLGGWWSNYHRAFVVPADRAVDVSDFANVTEKDGGASPAEAVNKQAENIPAADTKSEAPARKPAEAPSEAPVEKPVETDTQTETVGEGETSGVNNDSPAAADTPVVKDEGRGVEISDNGVKVDGVTVAEYEHHDISDGTETETAVEAEVKSESESGNGSKKSVTTTIKQKQAAYKRLNKSPTGMKLDDRGVYKKDGSQYIIIRNTAGIMKLNGDIETGLNEYTKNPYSSYDPFYDVLDRAVGAEGYIPMYEKQVNTFDTSTPMEKPSADALSAYIKEKNKGKTDKSIIQYSFGGKIAVDAELLRDLLTVFPDSKIYGRVQNSAKRAYGSIYMTTPDGNSAILIGLMIQETDNSADNATDLSAYAKKEAVGKAPTPVVVPEVKPDEGVSQAARDIVENTIEAGADIEIEAPAVAVNDAFSETPSVNPSSDVNKNYLAISEKVMTSLKAGNKLTVGELQKIAEEVYGGTMSAGVFDVKEMTDALELGVNRLLLDCITNIPAVDTLGEGEYWKNINGSSAENAVNALSLMERVLSLIPTQTKRSEEQLKLQQFSTPPNIAYLASWLGSIDGSDYVLEPSAGIGGLAVFAKAYGATVAVNEISQKRLGALNALGFDRVFSENGEYIDDLLPDNVAPTAVLMNPPFSSNGGRTKNSTKNACPHIEQALYRLEDGGRLVAILGQGMADNSVAFTKWWNDLRSRYNIRANVGIDGRNYTKYGTSFNVQLVVIDKTGPQGDAVTFTNDGKRYEKLTEIPYALEGIRNDRVHGNGTGTDAGENSGDKRHGAVAGSEADTRRSGSETEGEHAVRGAGSGVGTENGAVSGNERNGNGVRRDTGNSGGTGRGVGVDGDRSGNDLLHDNGGQADGQRNERTDVEGRTGNNETAVEDEAGRVRDASGRAERAGGSNSSSDAGAKPERVRERVKPSAETKADTPVQKKDDGVYAEYVSAALPFDGAVPHVSKLVESSAMSSVKAPEIKYVPNLPKEIITSGKLSSVQLENICLAGQAHQTVLPSGHRKGFFIGDGTGVGKGRQAAGIILDNWNSGRKKAIWVSQNKALAVDAKRDISALGGNADIVLDWEKARKNLDKINEGVLFVPYSTLGMDKPPKNGGKSNYDLIKNWLGEDFDGCIIYDEAHTMNNIVVSRGARGAKKTSQRAIVCNRLQDELKNARVTYLSATGATEVREIAFASRLGLWGEGTAFSDAADFINNIASAGISAMELMARDMKSLGAYNARNLSYDGVRYESLEHKLTDGQRMMYDTVCDVWQTALQRIYEALRVTNAPSKNAMSMFYSTLQNCYNQMFGAFSTPAVIEDIRNELEKGNSCVIQLTNTNEALLERELAKAKEKGDDLESVDLSPKDTLIQYVNNCFPVEMYEEYEDENGNKVKKQILDKDKNPVISKEAVRIRDMLLENVNEISLPESPIDMIINEFGVDMVAEVTGRQKRLIYTEDENGELKRTEQKITNEMRNGETKLFQNGDKRILIFSKAGATGRSFHSDRSVKNQQQRIHYVLQAGFNAKEAMQGFGRTLRTNMAIPPVYKLVQTDVQGQKRFVTSIARRLDQLGAMTKGQRQTGSGIFGEKDNLESDLSRQALQFFYKQLINGAYSNIGLEPEGVLGRMGMLRDFTNADTGRLTAECETAKDVIRFLNRLLALKVDEQNLVYNAFEELRQVFYDEALANGMIDTGLEYIKAERAEVVQREVIHKDDGSGAETEFLTLAVYNRVKPIPDVESAMGYQNNFSGLVRMKDSGAVYAVYRIADQTDAKTGRVSKMYRLQHPNTAVTSRFSEKTLAIKSDAIPQADWDSAWADEVKNLPEYNRQELSMVAGTLLTVWGDVKTLTQDGSVMKAKKISMENGEEFLGMVVPPSKVEAFLRQFNKTKNSGLSSKKGIEVYDAVMKERNVAVFRQRNGRNVTLKRSRVSNENRIEIIPKSRFDILDIKRDYPGIIEETIQYSTRWFIPTSKAGADIIDKMTKEMRLDSLGPAEAEGEHNYAKKNDRSKKGDMPKVEGGRTDGENPVYTMKPKDEIKARHEIIEETAKLFGVQISQGKAEGNVGLYKAHPDTIRLKNYTDFKTAYHELAHHLDAKYGLAEKLAEDIEGELMMYYRDWLAAAYEEEELPHEAIANFMEEYVSDPARTRAKFPDFTQHFLDSLSVKDADALDKGREMAVNYFSADTSKRFEAALTNSRADKTVFGMKDTEISEIIKDPEKRERAVAEVKKTLAETLPKAIKYTMLDDLAYIEDFGDTYDYAMHERKAQSRARHMYNYGAVNHNGTWVSHGLPDVLADAGIGGDKIKQFNSYLSLRRIVEQHDFITKWNRENPKNQREYLTDFMDYDLNDIEVQRKELARLSQIEGFSKAADGVYKYWQGIADYAIEAGIINDEAMEELRKQYPSYVPLHVVREEEISQSPGGAKSGYANQRDPIKKRYGSKRDKYAPLESMAILTEKYIKSADRNMTMQRFCDFLDNIPGTGNIGEKVTPDYVLEKISTGNITAKLEQLKALAIEANNTEAADAYNIAESIIGDYVENWEIKLPSGNKGSIITVMRNGRPEFYHIHDENVLKSLRGGDRMSSHEVWAVLQKTSMAFKALTTGLNPRFAFGSNIWKDLITAYLNDPYSIDPVRFGKETVTAFLEIMNKSETYKWYLANGGGFSGSATHNMLELRKVNHDLISKVSENQGKREEFAGRIQKGIIAFASVMEIAEETQRFAAFRRVMGKGGTIMEAERAAMESSINFQRKGAWSRNIDVLVPFSGSAMSAIAQRERQLEGKAYSVGLSKRERKKKAKEYLLKNLFANLAMLALEGAAFLLSSIALGMDEALDKYENLSEYQKSAYYTFLLPNGKFFKIAKPADTFGIENGMRAAAESIMYNDPWMFKETARYLAGAVQPYDLDNLLIVGSMFDIYANENYLGAPIVPNAQLAKSPQYQYDDDTSRVAITIGQLLKLSPMKIDYFLDQNAGYAADLIKFLTRRGGIEWDKATDGIKGKYYADSRYSTDIVNRFYDKKDEYSQKRAAYKEGLAGEYLDVYASGKYTEIADMYSALNKLRKEEKSSIIQDDYRDQMNAIIKAVNKAGMTDIDRKVSELCDRLDVESPSAVLAMLPIPSKISVSKAQKNVPLTFSEIVEYYALSETALVTEYTDIFASGITDDERLYTALKNTRERVRDRMQNELKRSVALRLREE